MDIGMYGDSEEGSSEVEVRVLRILPEDCRLWPRGLLVNLTWSGSLFATERLLTTLTVNSMLLPCLRLKWVLAVLLPEDMFKLRDKRITRDLYRLTISLC